MPWYATESDKRTARVIEEWKAQTFEAVHNDIAIWRGTPSERKWTLVSGWLVGDRVVTHHDDWMPPRFLDHNTSQLLNAIRIDFPKLDASPIVDVTAAILNWYADHGPARVLPQPELEAKHRDAEVIINALEAAISSRMVSTRPGKADSKERQSKRGEKKTLDERRADVRAEILKLKSLEVLSYERLAKALGYSKTMVQLYVKADPELCDLYRLSVLRTGSVEGVAKSGQRSSRIRSLRSREADDDQS